MPWPLRAISITTSATGDWGFMKPSECQNLVRLLREREFSRYSAPSAIVTFPILVTWRAGYCPWYRTYVNFCPKTFGELD